MFDQVMIFGGRPQGKCIFISCDYIYFSRFFESLLSSVEKNIEGYDNVHCHIVANNHQHKLILKNLSLSRCSFSFENVDEAKVILKNYRFEIDNWKKIDSIAVKTMLIDEFARNNATKRFAIKLLKFNKKIFNAMIDLIPPITNINNSKLKTYYSVRRFLMPDNFFNDVTSLLIIDVDSRFNSKISFADLVSETSCALTRNDMWSKYLAGFVFFLFEGKGKSSSLSGLKVLLTDLLNYQGIHWGVDQLALDALEVRLLLKPLNSLKHSFNKSFDEDTVFVSLKGDSKWDC
jgi:hypothetical protein